MFVDSKFSLELTMHVILRKHIWLSVQSSQLGGVSGCRSAFVDMQMQLTHEGASDRSLRYSCQLYYGAVNT